MAELTQPEKQEEHLITDIFGVNEYSPEKPTKREFLPWHKPRKHFVRSKQWLNLIQELIETNMPEGRVLKYLGLPGDDLLDIRYFHEQVCVKQNISMRFMGFNNSPNARTNYSPEANISLDEINKLQFIDQSSRLSPDNITQIAVENSMAWKDSYQICPYDVVNLDLCDGFGKHPIDNFQHSHYNTLKNILSMQSRAKVPWLLFLTTRTGNESINEEVLLRLRKLYEDNLTSCPEFYIHSSEKFNISGAASLEAGLKTSKGTSDIFLVGLCKWIAKLSADQNPPTKISIKNVLGYKVRPSADYQDLVSIAIKFTPILTSAPDTTGIATNGVSRPNECEMAVQALTKINTQKDVDKLLSENASLMQTMITDTAALLDEARYDVSKYEIWARSEASVAQ